jgi:hypothetical protein
VARHPRSWARHHTITDPDHARTAAALRGEYRHHVASRAAHSRAQAAAPDLVEVEQRELGTYDRVFTVIEGGAGHAGTETEDGVS